MQAGDILTVAEAAYIEALEEVWDAASDIYEEDAPSGEQWSRLITAMVAAEFARAKAEKRIGS